MRWNIFRRRQRGEPELRPVNRDTVKPSSALPTPPSPPGSIGAPTAQQLAARLTQLAPYVPVQDPRRAAVDLDALFDLTPTAPVKLVEQLVSGPPTPTISSPAVKDGSDVATGAADEDRFEDGWDDDSVEDDRYSGIQPPSYSPITLTKTPLCDDGRLGVVGESFYQEALELVTGGRCFGVSFDDHLPVTAVLVPEPENPYDPNAVRIDVLTGDKSLKVGYLARENVERYQPFLLELQEEGRIGTCPARICGGGPDRSYGIYLHVAPPESILAPPPIGPDASFARVLDGEIVLKSEWGCTVTREEDHQDELLPFAPRDGEDFASVRPTLDFCEVSRGKYRGQRAIEVRLGGARVGELTMAMTRRYAELVEVIHGRGAVATCYGYIARDPRRGLQLQLTMPRDPAQPRQPL